MRSALQAMKTPLTLIVLLIVLVGGFWWGYTQLTTPIPPIPPDPCVTTTLDGNVLKSSQVTVKIYNTGSVVGRASKISTQMKTKGFVVSGVTNAEDPVEQTTIVGSKADNPEVTLVAGMFKDAEIVEDGRVDNSVDVIVGDTYGGFNAQGPTQVAVPEGVACLPSQTPTAAAQATET